MKHWFKFTMDRVGEVLECVELGGDGVNRAAAEKVLRLKYPNIKCINLYAWGNMPPSWYR